jgi:ABC-2 type transport system permease protein
VAALVRMELLKIVKRPMTWVLGVLLHGGIGFGIVLGFLNLRSVDADLREEMLRDLTLPGIIPWADDLLYVFGSIMLAILAASVIGSEYSWGTLRPFLATGMPRTRFLAAKLLSLATVGLAFTILPLLMCALLAVPIALANDRPILAATVDLPWLLDLAALVGRCYLTVMVPTIIAFLVGLAGRSQAAGIGAALGLLIGEQIVSSLLLSLGLEWANRVIDLLPGRNSQLLVGYYSSLGPADIPAGLLGEGRALATLAAYGLACVVVALVIFRRREYRGAA